MTSSPDTKEEKTELKELEEERNEAYEGPLPFIAEAYLRPRYAETDAQGVVYHSNYIVWFEVARGEYCRAVDYPYLKIEQEGYGLMVTEVAVKYHSPCRYDDEIRIKAWIEKVGRASCVFGYQVFNDTTGKLSVEGLTKHAAVTPAGKLTRFSQPLYAIMLTRAGRGPSQLAPTK